METGKEQTDGWNVTANMERNTEKTPLREGLWKLSEASVNTAETTAVWLNAFPHIPAGVLVKDDEEELLSFWLTVWNGTRIEPVMSVTL